jgi:hypothetical protein
VVKCSTLSTKRRKRHCYDSQKALPDVYIIHDAHSGGVKPSEQESEKPEPISKNDLNYKNATLIFSKRHKICKKLAVCPWDTIDVKNHIISKCS